MSCVAEKWVESDARRVSPDEFELERVNAGVSTLSRGREGEGCVLRAWAVDGLAASKLAGVFALWYRVPPDISGVVGSLFENPDPARILPLVES